MKKSLSSKLMHNFMALIMIIIVGVTVGTSYLIADYFFKIKEQELAERGKEMAATVEYFLRHSTDETTLNRYVFAVDRLAGARVWLFDGDYHLLAASNINAYYGDEDGKVSLKNLVVSKGSPNLDDDKRGKRVQINEKIVNVLKEVYAGREFQSQIFHPYYEEQVVLIGIPYGGKGQPNSGAILLAQPMSGFEGFLTDIYIYTTLVAACAIILSIIMVRTISRTVIKPLVSMKDSAMAIAAGDYTHNVEVDGEDEVAELGNALNALSNDLSAFVDKMERTEKMRRDFVANVSHELRTPITIIRGYNEAITDGAVTDPEMIQRYRGLINEETLRLERMIRELLDISRMQASLELDDEATQPLPLASIMRNVAEKLMVNAAEKNVSLIVDADDDIIIKGQGDQMVQLIIIFGDNALKYSPQDGTIKFVAKRLEDGCVKLTIEDQGPGIPEKDLPFIWERFYKVDKSHSRNVPGTGLGLAIAKEIIRMHGAKGEVFSTVGVGTRFEITFPKDRVIVE